MQRLPRAAASAAGRRCGTAVRWRSGSRPSSPMPASACFASSASAAAPSRSAATSRFGSAAPGSSLSSPRYSARTLSILAECSLSAARVTSARARSAMPSEVRVWARSCSAWRTRSPSWVRPVRRRAISVSRSSFCIRMSLTWRRIISARHSAEAADRAEHDCCHQADDQRAGCSAERQRTESGRDEHRADDSPRLPAWDGDGHVVARQVNLGGELGAHLGDVELEAAQALHARLQLRQRYGRRVLGVEFGDVVAQLGRAAVDSVAARGVGLLRGELRRPAPRAPAPRAARSAGHPDRPASARASASALPVRLELGERGLAPRLLVAQPVDVGAQHLEVARVLLALGLVAPDRLLQLAPRVVRAPIGAAHRLLQPIAQRALVLCQAAQLLVMDAGRGAEELLRRKAGQARRPACRPPPGR